MRFVLTAVVMFVGGCFSPTISEGQYSCSPEGDCPPGMVCGEDGRCYTANRSGGDSVCGDDVCESPENCARCPSDCGECAQVCGDGVCAASETCGECPQDCDACLIVCGDGTCEEGENCTTCSPDCGECPEGCGDAICDADLGETCAADSCPQDCGLCCGNGVLDGGEDCDATQLADGGSCGQFGYYAGVIACDSECSYDLSGCSEYCGDGVKNGSEDCDANDQGSATCQDEGYHAGSLGCSGTCDRTTSGCSGTCGDGVLQSTYELCDGDQLGVNDCGDLSTPRYTGEPTCNLDCGGLGVGTCRGYCGDGVRQLGFEVCDYSPLCLEATASTLLPPSKCVNCQTVVSCLEEPQP